MYIDIHTHDETPGSGDTLRVRNYYEGFNDIATNQYCSIGLHPWYLEDYSKALHLVKTAAQQPNIIAIGECGLDKVCKSDWDLQVSVFKEMVYLANKVSKPLIIHCVRAFEELIKSLSDNGNEVQVIFHGYRNNANIANKLIEQGFFLSFGAAIMGDNTQAGNILESTPANRIFLETDDATIPIAAIYEKAAQLRNISVEAIKLQVEQNFRTVFKQ